MNPLIIYDFVKFINENNLIKSMNQYKEKNYDLENSIPLKVIGD
jgi:hypothetical protein